MNLRTTRDLLNGTLQDFGEDRVLRLSAALAYYAIFAIGPLLLIVVGIAGLVLGEDSVRHHLEQQLSGMIGLKATGIVESMMVRKQGTSVFTTVAGSIALLLGAGGVFGQMQDALDAIWEVKPKQGRGIKGIVRDRFLSLAMVFGIGFLLLVSMVISTALAASSEAVGQALALPGWVGQAVDLAFSFVTITVLFAAMFKYLPDVRIPWRNVWGGAAVTSLLFSIGKSGLAFYLGRESTASAYGAAGSVVLILMWVYYASVIVFFGAELTQVYTKQRGIRVGPTANAVPVTGAERAQQGMPEEQKEAPLAATAGGRSRGISLMPRRGPRVRRAERKGRSD